jgi:transcriptional regulator with XRE-family HTH domain
VISKQFGLIIKTMRSKKRVGLNEFASRLGVSPAYLSNLENGKTDTIQLHVMDLLREELQLNWTVLLGEQHDGLGTHPLQIRLNVAHNQLEHLIQNNTKAAEYLISGLEAGLAYCMSQKPSHNLAEKREVKPMLHH